jgi:hypothetical protein
VSLAPIIPRYTFGRKIKEKAKKGKGNGKGFSREIVRAFWRGNYLYWYCMGYNRKRREEQSKSGKYYEFID